MSVIKPILPKGMRDFNSDVMQKRNFIIKNIKKVFEGYGFSPIETPSIENLDTLSGKYGDEGDRLIFKILNSGDYLSKATIDDNTTSKSLTKQISNRGLRYDLTVPFARFVAQNRNEISFPFKRYQIQNVWRADRPQKGRYREFYQCDVDVIGSNSLFCEIELIQIYDDVLSNLNIPNINICINNRKVLVGMIELMGVPKLFDSIVVILDKLESIGLEKVKEELSLKGVDDNALSILDSFINAKNISEVSSLLKKSEIGSQGLQELEFILKLFENQPLRSCNLMFDISLARGLDYYTGCILEVKANDVNIGSLGGGGRYDDLTSNFGLNNVSGVGISFGLDRIYLVLEELNLFPKNIIRKVDVMFANFGIEEASFCLPLIKNLRANGVSVELYPDSEKIKKQMNYANSKGVKYVVLIGENEIKKGVLSIKDMVSGEQSDIEIESLSNKILNG